MNKLILLALVLSSLGIARAQVPWRQTAGPSGGLASRITVSSTGSVYVTSAAKVFRSTDDGKTWKSISDELPTLLTRWLVATPAGTLLLVVNVRNVPLFYRSTDEGDSWQRITEVDPEPSGIAVDSVNGSVYASTRTQVYRSTDEGSSWTMITSQMGGNGLHVANDNVFLLNAGQLKHFNTATPLVITTVPMPNSSIYQRFTLYGGDILVQVYLRSRQRLFRSSDLGHTWNALDSSVKIRTIGVARDGHLFAVHDGVMRSVDGGMTWSRLRPITDSLSYNDVQITMEGSLLSTTSRGISRSTDNGSTWHQSESGLISTIVTAMAPNARGGLFTIMYGHEKEIELLAHSMSDDAGATWRAAQPLPAWWHQGHSENLPAEFDGNGLLYVMGKNGLHRSSDNGLTWTALGLVGGKEIRSLAVATDTLFAVTEGDLLFMSGDKGATWMRVTTSPPLASGSGSVAYAQNGALVIGTDQRHYRSTDRGLSWTQSELTAPVGSYKLAANGYLYMRSASGLFRSPNGYSDWVNLWPMSSSVPPKIAILGATHLMLHDSLRLSFDDGQTWITWHNGIERESIESIAVDANGRFYAATAGSGVFYMDAPSAVSEPRDRNDVIEIPPTIVVSRDEVRVLVSSFCAEDMRLRLTDLNGATIAEALGRRLALSRIALGLYFLSMDCDGVRMVHKIMIDE